MRNPSGTLCVFFIFLGGSYLGSGLWRLRKGGRRESGLGTRNMGTLPGAYRSPPPSSPGSALQPWSSTSPRPSPAGNAGMPGQWYREPQQHRAQG